MKYLALLLAGLALLLVTGCSTTETRKYDVTVRNETDGPITVWLAKEGPPAEAGWRTPEQLALGVPGTEERIGGMVVPAGKTAYTGEIKGKFDYQSSAWLRVYEGQYKSFSDLLAVPVKSRDRYDQPLYPGRNLLVVRNVDGRIVVEDEGAEMMVPRTR